MGKFSRRDELTAKYNKKIEELDKLEHVWHDELKRKLLAEREPSETKISDTRATGNEIPSKEFPGPTLDDVFKKYVEEAKDAINKPERGSKWWSSGFNPDRIVVSKPISNDSPAYYNVSNDFENDILEPVEDENTSEITYATVVNPDGTGVTVIPIVTDEKKKTLPKENRYFKFNEAVEKLLKKHNLMRPEKAMITDIGDEIEFAYGNRKFVIQISEIE